MGAHGPARPGPDERPGRRAARHQPVRREPAARASGAYGGGAGLSPCHSPPRSHAGGVPVILKILVVVVIAVATVWGGSPLVRLLFRLADRSERTAPIEEKSPPPGAIQAAAGWWALLLDRCSALGPVSEPEEESYERAAAPDGRHGDDHDDEDLEDHRDASSMRSRRRVARREARSASVRAARLLDRMLEASL